MVGFLQILKFYHPIFSWINKHAFYIKVHNMYAFTYYSIYNRIEILTTV